MVGLHQTGLNPGNFKLHKVTIILACLLVNDVARPAIGNLLRNNTFYSFELMRPNTLNNLFTSLHGD